MIKSCRQKLSDFFSSVWFGWLLTFAAVLIGMSSASAAIVFSDDFESGSGNWNRSYNPADGEWGISSATSNSPSRSMFINGGEQRIELVSGIDLSSATAATVSVWIRRGDDNFSEDPDRNEGLELQFLNDAGSWQTEETFSGNGQSGQIFNRSYNLDNDQLHGSFRLRFRQQAGDGEDYDFWHVDDVSVDADVQQCQSGGLTAQFWNYAVADNGDQFPTSSPDLTRIDTTIDYDWGGLSPDSSIDNNRFAARWSGTLTAPESGSFTFATQSDDGVRVWLDNQLIIDNWTQHSAVWNESGSVNLVSGQQYNIRMEYFEHNGQAVARLHWRTPSDNTRRAIPSSGFYSCDVQPPVADWRLDENSWDGSADEVLDSSGNNYHGLANVALPVPGILCNAADLSANSTSDYLSMDSAAMNGLGDFTLIAWVKTNSNQDSTIISAASASSDLGANEATWYFQNNDLFWPTITASPFDSSTRQSSGAGFNDNNWHQLAWTRNTSNRESCLYVDGSLQSCSTHPDSNDNDVLSVITGGLIIGQEQDRLGSSFDISQDWEGLIDEMLVFDRILPVAEIASARSNILAGSNWDGSPRQCSAAIDRIAVTTITSASVCTPQSVTIAVYGSDGQLVSDYSGTVSLTTSAAAGDWLAGSADQPQGTLTNNGNGSGSYQFVASDGGSVELLLSHNRADQLTITAQDNAEGVSGTSNGVSFSENVIQISELDALDYDLVAGRDHLFRATLVRQDSSGVCGVATDYNYNLNLAGWLQRSGNDPSGSAPYLITNGSSVTQVAANSEGAAVTVPMNFSSGIADFYLRTSDTGQYTLNLKDSTSGYIKDLNGNDLPIYSSSQTWTVRPFGYRIVAAGNPGAVDHTGSAYIAAATDFNVTVAGVAYDGADDSNGDGHPDGHDDQLPGNNADLSNNVVTTSLITTVPISSYLYQPSSGEHPAISMNIGLSSGQGTSPTRFNEVGIIGLIGSTSALYGVNRTVYGASGTVGRFIPAQFNLTVDHGALSQSCGSFSYIGEIDGFGDGVIGYQSQPAISVTAVNSLGATTRNYRDSYQLLQASDIQITAPTEDAVQDGADSVTRMQVTARSNGSGLLNSGSLNVIELSGTPQYGELIYQLADSDRYLYEKDTNSQIAPFTANLELPVSRLQDSDGVTIASGSSLPIIQPTGTELRYGRWLLQNLYGPEAPATDSLAIAMLAQYFDGSQFLLNSADNCSAYAATSLQLSAFQGGLDDGESTLSGSGALVSGEPSSASAMEISLPGVGNGGSATMTYQAPQWLEFDWDGDDSLDDPMATVNFGQQRGADRVIFWREVN